MDTGLIAVSDVQIKRIQRPRLLPRVSRMNATSFAGRAVPMSGAGKMDWIKPASIIAVGAVFGANLRYFVSDWLARHQTASFPLGTLAVNTTGSLVLAFS